MFKTEEPSLDLIDAIYYNLYPGEASVTNGPVFKDYGFQARTVPVEQVPDADNDIDDNGNGLIDCADTECDGFVGSVTSCGVGDCASTGNLVCQNTGQIDTCTPGTPSGEGPFGDATCSDGIDNNCDSLIWRNRSV